MDGNERASPSACRLFRSSLQGLAESLRRRDAGQKRPLARAKMEAWLG